MEGGGGREQRKRVQCDRIASPLTVFLSANKHPPTPSKSGRFPALSAALGPQSARKPFGTQSSPVSCLARPLPLPTLEPTSQWRPAGEDDEPASQEARCARAGTRASPRQASQHLLL